MKIFRTEITNHHITHYLDEMEKQNLRLFKDVGK